MEPLCHALLKVTQQSMTLRTDLILPEPLQMEIYPFIAKI